MNAIVRLRLLMILNKYSQLMSEDEQWAIRDAIKMIKEKQI